MPCAGAKAQDQQPQGPVYIIQEGDSLWEIAQRFGVSVDDLVQTNGFVGSEPGSGWDFARDSGLSGMQGVLTTRTVQYGETLRSISRLYHLPTGDLAKLNHLATPAEALCGLRSGDARRGRGDHCHTTGGAHRAAVAFRAICLE